MLGFLNYVYIGIGALAALAMFSLYDGIIDDPAVERAARAGYVVIAEKTALEAQLAKERRLAVAAAQSLEEYRKRLSASQQAENEASERHETEIAEYEAKLKAAGNEWRLDRGDLDFFLRP